MHIKIGIDMNFEGKTIAWALDYPGCFVYGAVDQEALLLFPKAFLVYQRWINQKAGADSWVKNITNFDVRLTESFKNYQINEDYERVDAGGHQVMSWFQSEWKPLNRGEVLEGIKILQWNREDLLNLIQDLTPEQLSKEYAGERWTIAGIISHIGRAEWWYLDQLDCAGMTRQALPSDPIKRITVVREQFNKVLPDLAGEELVRGKEGELWSPRKILRRAAWHERDHINHIQKILNQ